MWDFHGQGMLELADHHPAGELDEFDKAAKQARFRLQQMDVVSDCSSEHSCEHNSERCVATNR